MQKQKLSRLFAGVAAAVIAGVLVAWITGNLNFIFEPDDEGPELEILQPPSTTVRPGALILTGLVEDESSPCRVTVGNQQAKVDGNEWEASIEVTEDRRLRLLAWDQKGNKTTETFELQVRPVLECTETIVGESTAECSLDISGPGNLVIDIESNLPGSYELGLQGITTLGSSALIRTSNPDDDPVFSPTFLKASSRNVTLEVLVRPDQYHPRHTLSFASGDVADNRTFNITATYR